MSDLTDFLSARYDDDHERADFVARQWAGDTNHEIEPWQLSWHDEYDLLCIEPSRALAEVEANQLLLRLHKDCADSCYILRVLALPYANHPEYRAEWTPFR